MVRPKIKKFPPERTHSKYLIFRALLLWIPFFVLNSCARKPMETSLPFQVPSSFSLSGESTLTEKWWEEFEDPALNNTIDSAFKNNLNLRSVWERLNAANAIAERESASFFPTLDAFVQGETGSGQTAFDVNDNIRIGMTADYEIDLWGRIRSAVDAERFRAEATVFDYKAAAVSLSAELVLSWYQLAEARMQHNLAREQTEINKKILDLLKARFGSGQSRSVDILRQQELLEATREEEIRQETRVQLLENQVAVLTGIPPQDNPELDAKMLPELPGLPETGIPLDLVKRRPDVQSAYYQLMAADRDLASAMSNRYPRISVSTQLTTNGGGADQLFRNWAWSLSGNIFAPLFFGGELQAEVDRNEAVKNQRLYEYGQTILTAFREVEDALVREIRQQDRIASMEKQYDLAVKSNRQLRYEYFNGLNNYLDVLTALEREQQLERSLLNARMELLDYRVGLYRALAGGLGVGEGELRGSGTEETE